MPNDGRSQGDLFLDQPPQSAEPVKKTSVPPRDAEERPEGNPPAVVATDRRSEMEAWKPPPRRSDQPEYYKELPFYDKA
jgi:hypothetical protein